MLTNETLKLVRQSKVVDADTEKRLIAEGRTEDLVLANLKLVASIVTKYSVRSQSHDDLFMVGVVGLNDAIRNYDKTSDVRFATYAQWWIRRAVGEAVKEDNLVHVPFNIQNDNAKKVKAGEEVIDYGVTSMDAMIGDGGSFHEILGSVQEEGDGVSETIKYAITNAELSEKETFVITHLFGLDDGEEWTMVEIASELGCSAERVRQIKNAVMLKLKNTIH